MKSFRYKGLSSSGAHIEGIVEAFDKADAATRAREHCRVLVSIEPVASGTLGDFLHTDIGTLLSGGRIPAKKLALLSSLLAIALQAGIPLVRSLQLVAENEADRHLKQILEDVTDDVQAGNGLAKSFQTRAPKLPAAFLETIRAGEASGQLAEAFARLKVYYEKSAATASRVSSALVYPVMLVIVAVIVIAVIMVFAVPVFEDSFSSMGSDLPGPTQALIAISRFFTSNPLLLAAFTAIVTMSLLLFSKTEAGRRTYARIALTFPVLGRMNRMYAAAQFSSTLAAMIAAGLSLVQAARVTASTAGNPLIQEDLHTAIQGVLEGRTLSRGLEKSQFFPKLLVEMTAVGEETGSLEETMQVISEYYTKEVDTTVQNALGILEPGIMLLLAGLVVFILLAVYLPIFGMYGPM